MKSRINISLDEDTLQKLKEIAAKEHKNVSQWVTDQVWMTEKSSEREKGNGTHQ